MIMCRALPEALEKEIIAFVAPCMGDNEKENTGTDAALPPCAAWLSAEPTSCSLGGPRAGVT